MWYLVEDSPASANTPPPKYWLGGTHSGGRVIGRKKAHIRIKAASVSRTHATIRVIPTSHFQHSEYPVRRRTTSVVVEDKSAYGTYVKYPPGHDANRSGDVEGHHRRLDKNAPTEVQEGALLAFGAPSSWWRLGWCEIVCFPSGLWQRHQERLQEVTKIAGLEVVKEYSKYVTHFITGECKTSSMKFLIALVQDKHIVTPAWATSVQQTVNEACMEITEAQNNAVALAACKLAKEALYVPPFNSADKYSFSADVLDCVFAEATKNSRKSLFSADIFAFSREDRRAKWAPVLELLGASTVLVRAMKGHTREKDIVIVTPDPSKRKRSTQDSSPQAGETGPSVSETVLIKAILSGDKSDITAQMLRANAAPVSDLVDEHEGTVDDGDDRDSVSDVEAPEPLEERPSNQKRVVSPRHRSGEKDGTGSAAEEEPSSGKENIVSKPATGTSNPKANAEEEYDDPNERKFFKAPPVSNSATPAQRTESSVQDVRRFRRKYLPRGAKVPLKRARYMEEEDVFPARKYDRSGASGSRARDEDS